MNARPEPDASVRESVDRTLEHLSEIRRVPGRVWRSLSDYSAVMVSTDQYDDDTEEFAARILIERLGDPGSELERAHLTERLHKIRAELRAVAPSVADVEAIVLDAWRATGDWLEDPAEHPGARWLAQHGIGREAFGELVEEQAARAIEQQRAEERARVERETERAANLGFSHLPDRGLEAVRTLDRLLGALERNAER